MDPEKVLVLNSTGKVGRNTCRALKEAGFEVYGTTRSRTHDVSKWGITPVICDYTDRAQLDRAIRETGVKKLFAITDYFGAAKSQTETEISHGRNAIDAAKAAKIEHFIFVSVADAEGFNEQVSHIKTKLVIEEYLRQSGIPFSILRPTAFFENLDDAKNWNPLKKGRLKFLSTQKCKYCST